MVSELLTQEYHRLNNRLQTLQQQGIAPENTWLSPNRRQSKKGIRTYWRVNTKTEHGTVTDYLGIEGCVQHLAWDAKIVRREEASELKIQLRLLNELINRQAAIA